jgi:hypothetical protein
LKYRAEATQKAQVELVRELYPRKYVGIWLAGFPGYLIFSAGWLCVLSALTVWITKLLIHPKVIAPLNFNIESSGGSTFSNPILELIFMLLVVAALISFYWAVATYTARIIHWAAIMLDVSTWTIKSAGLPLGALLGTISIMLAEPSMGLTPAVVAAALTIIGFCSFGLERACINAWSPNKNNPGKAG